MVTGKKKIGTSFTEKFLAIKNFKDSLVVNLATVPQQSTPTDNEKHNDRQPTDNEKHNDRQPTDNEKHNDRQPTDNGTQANLFVNPHGVYQVIFNASMRRKRLENYHDPSLE